MNVLIILILFLFYSVCVCVYKSSQLFLTKGKKESVYV